MTLMEGKSEMDISLQKDIDHTKLRISILETEIEKARARGFKAQAVGLKSQLQMAKNRLRLLQIAAS
jgi:hypothetical protein